MTNWVVLAAVVTGAVALGSGPAPDPFVERLRRAVVALRPLCKPLPKPGPSDWLANHAEPGETFDEFLKSGPVTLGGKRRVMYIQPLGSFSARQRRVLDFTAKYLAVFFSCRVVMQPGLPASIVAADGWRVHPDWGNRQILTTVVLNRILRPRLPEDAAACLGFTATDLWPGEGWNFVFGQASLRDRVGVWSLYRLDTPGGGKEGEELFLRRTLKISVHETGHMFSMLHCTARHCGMNGTNNLEEEDSQPLHFCSECTAKVCWASGAEPAAWTAAVGGFLEKVGLKVDAEFYRKAGQVLAVRKGV